MTRWNSTAVVVVLALCAMACGGGQKKADAGAGERAGAGLDEAANSVKETGDEVGQQVGGTLGDAGKDINEKLGNDPHAPPPDIKPMKDGG